MTAILYRAPAGVVGEITRAADTTVETGIFDPGASPSVYGGPVKLVNGLFRTIQSGDTAAVFYGICARSVPSTSGGITRFYNSGQPYAEVPNGVVRRGYVNVACPTGTPVRGAPVYMRVIASGSKAVADLEATADGVNNVLLPGVTWAVDGKDSSNITEIRIA